MALDSIKREPGGAGHLDQKPQGAEHLDQKPTKWLRAKSNELTWSGLVILVCECGSGPKARDPPIRKVQPGQEFRNSSLQKLEVAKVKGFLLRETLSLVSSAAPL